MWWSRTLLALALLAVGPAACGFRPLYGTSETGVRAASQALPGIRVAAIENRMGQQLRNALVQRLTPGGEPARYEHDLVVQLDQQVESLGYSKDAKASLGRMTVTARYQLFKSGNRGVHSGTSRSVVSYNYLGPRYASTVMERDSEERAILEVAEDIRRQLAAYFETRASNPGAFQGQR